MSNPYHIGTDTTQRSQDPMMETLLSAHASWLPTSDESQVYYSRKSAAATLSEVYPPRRVNKALDFVQLVRSHLAGRPGAYDQFFKALKLHEEGRVELLDVLLRIMILCADSPNLLQQLNHFLPNGYAFSISMQSMEAHVVVLKTPTKTLHQSYDSRTGSVSLQGCVQLLS